MNQFATLLHNDITKYKDIFNIFMKLTDEGVIKDISQQFYKVFSNESKYTLDELLKFQKEKNERINIGKQYEANLSLFMDNFQLLCKHIIENTFKVVVKESQEIVKNRLSTQEETEREYINSENNYSVQEDEKSNVQRSTYDTIPSQLLKLNEKSKLGKSGSKKSIKQQQGVHSSSSRSICTLQNIVNGNLSTRNTQRLSTQRLSNRNSQTNNLSSRDNENYKSVSKTQPSLISKRSSVQISTNGSLIGSLQIPVNVSSFFPGMCFIPKDREKILGPEFIRSRPSIL